MDAIENYRKLSKQDNFICLLVFFARTFLTIFKQYLNYGLNSYETMLSIEELVLDRRRFAQQWPYTALQGKSHLFIPFLGIAWSQSHFLHSCVCERFIYSQDRSTYFPAAE
jgi:hypothetical protein